MIRIPAFDLQRAIQAIGSDVEDRWHELVTASAFVGGAEVDRFERAFAEFVGAADCVGVANGTDALILALRALDLRPGDEVLVPSFTFIATAATVALTGGVPVFVDVEADTLNLDWVHAESCITERTVGVIGVHLYGRPFAVDRARQLTESHGLWLIEDSAQAHGAEWQGTPVGNFGRLATWSFYPAKNLGCFGDGGAVTGNDPELLARVRRLANHGRTEHYEHSEVGLNSRLDGLQAAVLNTRLPGLAAANRRRREIALRYRDSLTGVGDLRFLTNAAEALPVYHQKTVLTASREALRSHLDSHGIGTGIHYPKALHLQAAFATHAPPAAELPVATRAGDEVLCLPMFAELTDAEVDEVCAAVRSFF
jgi:dTDP-4-amino-4,6-dideoxygalactose transaminase